MLRLKLVPLTLVPLALVVAALAHGQPSGRVVPGAKPVLKEAAVDFNRDVLPILANNCFICHGPSDQKGGLRLDLREHALKPTRSKATPILPGKSAESELIRRILADDDAERMPPIKSKKTLSTAEKDLLKKWIDQGAAYKLHWAFVAPTRPPLPKVNDKAWVKNEIDAFILAQLEQAGLRPSPRADKTTLIRRLSLDLRGVPPSLAEVDEFLSDPAPDAYAKLVDRMLASPRFGEKMALLWLDLARFGDTSGFENDSSRQMWKWRDWVIDAFNQNMPFDQFTIEQLAGDHLPNATTAQKVASGFNRNTRFNEETGSDPDEFVIRYNVDRANTLGQVWLGLTLGCAECHSHKYDPISQKEYYQLFAYFTGIKEPHASTGLHNVPLPPILKFPSLEQAKTMTYFENESAKLKKQIDANLTRLVYRDPLEIGPDPVKPLSKPRDTIWFDDAPPAGATFAGKWQWRWDPLPADNLAMVLSGPGQQKFSFTGAAKSLYVNAGDKFFVNVYLDPKNPPKSITLQYFAGAREYRAQWGQVGKGKLPGRPTQQVVGPLPAPGKWTRLEIAAVRPGLLPDTLIDGMAFMLTDGTAYFDRPGIQSVFPTDERPLRSVRHWEPRGKVNPFLPPEVKTALDVAPDKRSAEQKTKILHYYVRNVFAPTRDTFAPLQKNLAQFTAKRAELDIQIPYTMVSEEMAEPRPAYVLVRGDFLKKGEKVERAVPSIFPPLPAGAPNNRLGLARWLMRPDHPLTARVAVNRFWAQLFGIGIVKTIGDFGTQGEYPSHPELLDWLAMEFMSGEAAARRGARPRSRPARAPLRGAASPKPWDVKALLKMIVLSNTYQQSSAVIDSPAAKLDPHNRLLSRAPRFRLSAEEIRDSALAISGLLSPKIGGPSVMPYQPGDFYKGKNEGWPWAPSKGDEQYRRGMYTFWRRTTLHPMFAIFDAPSREECSVARSRTNTPLQALVTLNDPTFVEAARVFAQKVLTDGPTDTDARLHFAFRTAVARIPAPAELRLLKVQYEKNLERYQANKDAAAKLLQVGMSPRPTTLDAAEHAAWTSVCNILLNLDEAITRE